MADDFSGDFGGFDPGVGYSPSNYNGPQPTIRQNLDTPGIISPIGSTVVVQTVSLGVISGNGARRGIIFINPGTNPIYVTPGNLPAAVGYGILVPAGGQVEFIGDGNLVRYTCGWNAISTAANSSLTILELV